MCGSLLSKLKKPPNRVEPAIIIFPEPKQVKSQNKLVAEDSACHEDRGFWKEGERNGESSTLSIPVVPSNNSLKDGGPRMSESACSPHEELEVVPCALDCTKQVLPAINSTYTAVPLVERNSEHLLESAREILALQIDGASSSSNTVSAEPLRSTNSLPLKMKTPVTFDIPACNEKTVCSSPRVPARLRKRGKLASALTLEDFKERMRAAEERKLKELERIRESARSRAGDSRPHPADVSALATKEKIAAKQAAVERKRTEEMENRKQAVTRVSQKTSRIAEAKALKKTQLESSIEHKMEKSKERKVNHQQKNERKKKQKQLREEYAKKVKDRVSKTFHERQFTSFFIPSIILILNRHILLKGIIRFLNKNTFHVLGLKENDFNLNFCPFTFY